MRTVAITLGVLGVAAAAFLAGVFRRELGVRAVAVALGVFGGAAAAFLTGVGSRCGGLGHKKGLNWKASLVAYFRSIGRKAAFSQTGSRELKATYLP